MPSYALGAADASLAPASNEQALNYPSEDSSQVVRSQRSSFLMTNFSATLTHPSASIQPPSSVSSNNFDPQETIAALPHYQTDRPLSVPVCDSGDASNEGQSSSDLTTLPEDSQLHQGTTDDFMGFDPLMDSDSMELASFNIQCDENVPHSMSELVSDLGMDDHQFQLDGQLDNESLMALLDFDNQKPQAMLPWRSKNDGNRFLNPSWKAQ